MQFVVLFFLTLAVAFSQVSGGVFDGSTYMTFTPVQPEAATLGSYRIEFRISGYAVDSHHQGIVGNNDGDTQCLIVSNTLDLRCRNWRGGDSVLLISLTGRQDIRARYQRDNTTRIESLEVWNADGSGYTVATAPLTPVVFNASTLNFVGAVWGRGSEFRGQMDFVRWYSSALPLKSRIPADGVSVLGEILDMEFDGSTQESVLGRQSAQSTGSIQYAPTRLFPPAARAANAIVRAGYSVLLDGSLSSSLNDDLPLRAEWTCLSGPTSCNLSTTNKLVSSFVPPQAGTYLARLTVTDSMGMTASTNVEIGSVASDDLGRVAFPNAALELAIGPLTRSGTSQWTWFDKTEIDAADAILAAIPPSPGDIPGAGSVSVTAGSQKVIGSGTWFSRTFACNGSDNIVLLYPVPGQPNGRRTYKVTGCPSDWELSISPAYDASASASGVLYSAVSDAENAQWVNGSNNWNYYDAVVALYRAYYRTGLERFRTGARALADKWYQYPFDRGRAWADGDGYYMLAPRMIALTGLMLRANDGKPEYWNAITTVADWQYRWLSGYYAWNKSKEVGELREQGYVSLFMVQMAILHPDVSTRNRFRNYASTAFTSYWRPTQRPNGGWYFGLDPAQNYYGVGTLPWQGSFVATYLVQLHRLTGDKDALASLKKFADFMSQYGIDPNNDGGYYDAFFQFCPDWNAASNGSVTVTKNSTAVTGVGTDFRSRYRCNGSDAIAIQDQDGMRRFYTVSSCQSDSALQLAQRYAGDSDSGLRHLKYNSASVVSGCGICPWGTCGTYGTGAKGDARSLLNGSHGYFGYLYAAGQGTRYRDVGDRLFARNLGPGGPGGDTEHGNYDDATKGAQLHLSKSFAFVGGASGAQPYLAWRLGPQSTPVNYSRVSVDVERASANQGQARLRLYGPNGEMTETVCAQDVCTFDMDEFASGFTYEIVFAGSTGAITGATARKSVPLRANGPAF